MAKRQAERAAKKKAEQAAKLQQNDLSSHGRSPSPPGIALTLLSRMKLQKATQETPGIPTNESRLMRLSVLIVPFVPFWKRTALRLGRRRELRRWPLIFSRQ